MVLLGLGAGVAAPALMSLAMSTATPGDSGLASGLINTTVQVGGALGLAVLATLAEDRTEGLLARGAPAADALTSGFHHALLVGAALTAIAIPVAAAVLRSGSSAAAEPEPLVTESVLPEAA